MARVFKPQFATGNHLLEGDVVYFTQEGTWSRDIADADLALSKEAADELLASASRYPNEIVGVYLADANVDTHGNALPAHFREEFRMRGPSNRPEHGRAVEKVQSNV